MKMKQFDWGKYPDIDVVAWDKDGKCFGYGIKPKTSIFIYQYPTKLPKYDIDPNTEGFDWKKSKQVRPTVDNQKSAELENKLVIEKEYYKEVQKWREPHELGAHSRKLQDVQKRMDA